MTPTTPCRGGFPNYHAAETASRRSASKNLGYMVWRCSSCGLFHTGRFAFDVEPDVGRRAA